MASPATSVTRKLEDLPSDGGATVDTLAGAMLRTFVRLNALEARLAQLEKAARRSAAAAPEGDKRPG